MFLFLEAYLFGKQETAKSRNLLFLHVRANSSPKRGREGPHCSSLDTHFLVAETSFCDLGPFQSHAALSLGCFSSLKKEGKGV